MTHPSDIAGLSERLRIVDSPDYGKTIHFVVTREDVSKAATALDALQARVKELEQEAFGNELLKNTYRNECAMAVNRALRAEQQRDEAVRVTVERCLSAVYDADYLKDAIAAIRRLASGPEGGEKPQEPTS